MTTLDSYVDNLIKEKSLKNVYPDVLLQVKKDLRDRVEERVNAIIILNLPDSKLRQFDSLLEQGNAEQINKFTAENVPNLQELMAQELLEFRKVYLGL